MVHVPLFEQWRASGREVAVVGLGKSGVAAGLLLRDHGVPTYASDIGTGPTFDAWAASLGKAGATVHIGAHDLERIARAVAVVVAPGVPPEAPPLETARRAAVPRPGEPIPSIRKTPLRRCGNWRTRPNSQPRDRT